MHKKIIIYKITMFLSCIALLAVFVGCNLLETTSDDELSGEKFWSSGKAENVEGFTLSIYNSFRHATMVNCAFLTLTGDFRCAPISMPGNINIISDLRSNQLGTMVGRTNADNWRQREVTRWDTFYEVVQSSNILIEEVANVTVLTNEEKAAYNAEGVFMRNLAYFFMVRVFGDVPYYTNAYNSVSLPRTDMVTVLKKCLADLQGLLDSDPDARALPWAYESAAKSRIRASRGAALVLMMHISMWLVQFDTGSAPAHYQKTASLGNELINNNGGAYYLLPIEQSSAIFAGNSRESLFDVVQDVGMDELFLRFASFSDCVNASSLNIIQPAIYYNEVFLERIFPEDEPDGRVNSWFAQLPLITLYREVTKFVNAATSSAGRLLSNSGNQIIFRYADAILLYAEAAAATGDEETARNMLNMIRARAGTTEKSSSGTELRDDIYWERVRELIGEGHYFYDLVRTGKVYDWNYNYNVITRTNFNAGAWTWPIHSDALNQNTHIQLNPFWMN